MRPVLRFLAPLASLLVAAFACVACEATNAPKEAASPGAEHEDLALPAPASSPPTTSRRHIVAACAWSSVTCTLEGSGDVRCWGGIEEPGVATPRTVAHVPGAIGLDCNGTDLWIVRQTGDLSHVRFGKSTSPDSELHDVVALRHVGPDGVCALRRDGHVTCWGWLAFSDVKPSVTISGLDSAAQLECGHRACCAILRDGGIRCFGERDAELGTDGATARTPPVAVGHARTVAVANRYACTFDRDGVRTCWGHTSDLPSFSDASASRFGKVLRELCTLDCNGKLACAGNTSLPEDLGDGIAEVVDGNEHTCVIRKDGTLGCWGSNDGGQLGDGIPLVRNTPARIAGLDDVTELNVAHTSACARKKDGTTWCWGDGLGQPTRIVVDGTIIPAQYAPGCTYRLGKLRCAQTNLVGTEWSSVSADPRGAPKDLQSAAIDRAPNLYLLDRGGNVSVWFSMSDSGMAARVLPMTAPTKVHALAPTAVGACALLDGGRVACFDDHRHDTDDKYLTQTPVSRAFREIPGLTGAVQLAGGGSHACARIGDGRVMCFSLEGKRTAREVESARGASDLASNDNETCAVVKGEVLCWAFGGTPARVPGLPPIVHVGSGRESRCALDRDSHVWCWGNDSYGELGAGRRRRVTDHVVNVAGIGP